MNCGLKHWNRKLTSRQVHEIRLSTDQTVVLSAKYGVNKSHIRKIRRGHCWKSAE